MQTKGSVVCEMQFQQWGTAVNDSGARRFDLLSPQDRRLALEIWQAAWEAAVAQAASSQEQRSTSRHGWDKHDDAQALLRELSPRPMPEPSDS